MHADDRDDRPPTPAEDRAQPGRAPSPPGGEPSQRDRALVVAGVATVVLASAAGLGLLLADGDDDAARALPATTSSASPSPDPSATPAPSRTPSASPPDAGDAGDAGEAVLTIPADLPLAAGYPETDEAGEPVTAASGPGPGVTLCGRRILTGRDAAAVSSVSLSNPEDTRTRTLMVFQDEAEASAAVEWTTGAATRCADSDERDPAVSIDVLGDVEGPGSLVFGQNYGLGPDRVMATNLVRLARVGNAVVVDTTDGEASGRADSADADQVVSTREALAPVLDAMAVYATG